MEQNLSYLGRHYSVEEKISEGSFGVIMRVKETKTGHVLAAKIFEEEEWVSLSDDEEETTMSPTALREISFMQLLARHNAPHVARVLDFDFSLADYFALVVYMPLYCGDLSDAISEERLDCRQRFQVAQDILQAIAFMHSCSPPIVHRDIKPENVLLDEHNRGALADFGFACFAGPLRKRVHSPKKRKNNERTRDKSDSQSRATHSGVLGTVTYIAPEVLKGSHPHSSADMWATGVMLLEMLENDRLDTDTDAGAFKLLKTKTKSLDDKFLIPRTIKSLLQKKSTKRMTASLVLSALDDVGLLKEPRSRDSTPDFTQPPELIVTQETETLCKKLKAVVPDTFAAAELYCRIAPDMDARTLAMIAAKVHEHIPMRDESMVAALDVDIEALENDQEEMLRRTGGSLLLFGNLKISP